MLNEGITYITYLSINQDNTVFLFDIRKNRIRPILDYCQHDRCYARLSVNMLEYNKFSYITFSDFLDELLLLYPDLVEIIDSRMWLTKQCFYNIFRVWYTLVLEKWFSGSYDPYDAVVDYDDFDIKNLERKMNYGYCYSEISFLNNFLDTTLNFSLITSKPKVEFFGDYCYIDFLINSNINGSTFKVYYKKYRKRFIELLKYSYILRSTKKDKLPISYYKLSDIHMIGRNEVRFVLELKIKE